jgi:hypothetical protein
VAIKKAVFQPTDFLAKEGSGRTRSTYATGQVTFSQGEAADAVFYIRTGKVKVAVVSEHGKEGVVARRPPGSPADGVRRGGEPQDRKGARAHISPSLLLQATEVID